MQETPLLGPAGHELAAAPDIDAMGIAGRIQALKRRARERLAASLSSHSLWPYAAVLSPVIGTTVLAPVWLSFAMGLLGVTALYKVATQLEPGTWQPDARRAFLAYGLPLQVLLLAWVAAAGAAGQGRYLAATVFPYIAVLCVAVAPACRWNRARTARRVPLRWSLPIVAVLALTAHGAAALRSLGVWA